MVAPMVSVSHLVKRYGAHAAVFDLTFSVGKGEVTGFLGPNGAGKSTTLRILAGFLGMTSGEVRVAGHDVVSDSFAARKQVGYMPEAVPLYPEMRVSEYLAFRAQLKAVPRAARRAHVDLAMEKAKVTDVATKRIGTLSKGYRQRVGLADALVAKPPLLILDEPTAGLDPNQIREVREVLRALGSEHTVLLSTHILSEVEASCSRVVVIAKGKLVAEGATRDIARLRHGGTLDLTVRGEGPRVLEVLRAAAGVSRAEALETGADPAAGEGAARTYRCTWSADLDVEATAEATEGLVAQLVERGLSVRAVRPGGSSLEDVFAELTRAPAERGAA